MPPPQRGLDYWLFKLVGSFCKKHAVTLFALAGDELRLFVSKWFQVLFHRGQPPTFHLSLTVLVHYR